MKKCIGCSRILPEIEEFFYFRKDKDRLNNKCIECVLKQQKQYRQKSETKKQIKKYQEKYQKRYYQIHQEIILDQKKKKHRYDPRKQMFLSSKQRAKKKGLEHNISIENIVIPERCPVLGILIYVKDSKITSNSPTLDRIDNTKGYVKGNVKVISWRANSLKSDGTSEEHRKIAEYIEKNGYNK